tara:strand:+ start:1091 stop:2644 length:1554 start_codon:yes stop_codon:yes gene_type:complete
MTGKQNFYITTPIYYVNDSPHIGHAYTTLACDVVARFKRLDGFNVFFLTGTDEHGQKVEQSAYAAGFKPQEFTDLVSKNFRELAEFMNYSHDEFIRTTEDRHKKASQAIWAALEKNGHIYLGKYSGWYAVRDEAFYAENEITERNDGTKIAPSGAECEWVEEPSYFFNLSKWQDKLLQFYEDNPGFIAPTSRRNEVISFVKGGMHDLSISRTSFKWGVGVPGNKNHIMYVWLDALTNYITALDYPDNKGLYAKFWPANLHMVGKDILRFHAVYWPAFLMGAGLPLPKRVFAHGWWTNEGKKISKSLGNVIDPTEIVKTYGLDQVRYFLMREVPFGNDGDFSHDSMLNRINSDLANDLGNLVQRVLAMVQNYCNGTLPKPSIYSQDDEAILLQASNMLNSLKKTIDKQAFHEALDIIWTLVRAANGFVDRQAPWQLNKNDPERRDTVLYVLAETIRHLGIYIQPFMPSSASKILDLLSVKESSRLFSNVGPNSALAVGTLLPKPKPVFPRYDDNKKVE